MKKKTKIKWKNILLAIVGIITSCIVLDTVYTITIRGWITNQLATITWAGIVVNVISLTISISIILYFIEEMEKRSDK